jgi:hypothetical protein
MDEKTIKINFNQKFPIGQCHTTCLVDPQTKSMSKVYLKNTTKTAPTVVPSKKLKSKVFHKLIFSLFDDLGLKNKF